jgi:hypothetical protein
MAATCTISIFNNNNNGNLYSAGIRHKWRSWRFCLYKQVIQSIEHKSCQMTTYIDYLVKATLNKWVFKSFLKLFILQFNRMIVGKLFHSLAAAIPKALSPHLFFARFDYKRPCSDERRARRGVYG